jgi:2-aminoadipate transaminase
MSNVWDKYLAQHEAHFTNSIIRDLLRLTEQPSIISFAGGLPAPECFPAEELTAAAERILVENPLAALQYGPTEGYRPLRTFVTERAAQLGINATLDQVMITSGSQQALDLIGRRLIGPGDLIAVEDPTYLGALQSWYPRLPQYVTVPMDEHGMDVAALEQMLKRTRPTFLYIMPTFQNPTGVTLAEERRRDLIDVASRYELPIIEDDPYGDLFYDGERPRPLAALDVEKHGKLRTVVYISSFSKLLSPGLRVGWTAAPESMVSRLVQVKQGVDLHTSSLTQATVYEACRDGLLERHIPSIQNIYRRRRDAMLSSLAQHMPEGVRWTCPGGGMFVWLMLPPGLDALELFHEAIKHEVAFVPGTPFYANGGGGHAMRLNFSLPTAEQIEEGIARLGRSMRGKL